MSESLAEEAVASARRRNRWLLPGLAVFTALLVVAGCWIAMAYIAPPGRIARNVFIEGIPVGGLTRDEALRTLTADWLPQLPDRVILRAGEDSWPFPPEVLGQTLLLDDALDSAMSIGHQQGVIPRLRSAWRIWRTGAHIDVKCMVDQQRLRECLIELAPQVDRMPRNADVEVIGERDVRITPGAVGRSLQLDASLSKLSVALTSPRVRIVDLVVETQEPAVKAQDLAHIETVLSSYTTKFNPSLRGRTANIRKAAGIINKTVLKPGDVFSLNDIVGARLAATGWRVAKIYQNGEIVDGIGGGICQVASTVYNAALLANLEILERHSHSLPVTYVPVSRDATVAYGQRDLKFRNSLSSPILLLASVGRNTLTVKIIGAEKDRYDVTLIVSGVGTIPHGVKEIPDPELDEGERKVETKGINGRTGTLTQVVKKDGQVIKRQVLHSDRYAPVKEVVRVGAKVIEPPDELPPTDLTSPSEPSRPAPTDARPTTP